MKSRFAVLFGNRGFFPASLQKGARKEMGETLRKLGHTVLMTDPKLTNHGAVETPADGEIVATWLRKNEGKIDGIILCLPNFGDETGAVSALQDAGLPILVQAYPDELTKMAPALRRDAFCGKFSIMDVFCQYGVKFTALQPHTVHPKSEAFAANIDTFDRLCRVVKGMRRLVVGSIGARTTAFKTVRIDELALQRHGITMETFDLSDIFARLHALKTSDKKVVAKDKRLAGYCSWKGTPKSAREKLAKLGVVLDDVREEGKIDALAVRCWIELQQQLGISPCVLLSEMNDRDIAVACEVDVGNAVTMHALRLASGQPATCLDWNNNYGNDQDKCILFHCGPVPQRLMTGKGQITDHAILANAVGEGCSYGCNTGRIRPMDATYGSMLTEEGQLKFYLGRTRYRTTSSAVPASSRSRIFRIRSRPSAMRGTATT
ncbi:MAG: L-fucose/L-arabinose isomerase family protein [Planctomycetota bacterium]|jgi:L-fucose isomerase-like protein